MGSKLLLGAVHLSLPERLKVKNKKKREKKVKKFSHHAFTDGWLVRGRHCPTTRGGRENVHNNEIQHGQSVRTHTKSPVSNIYFYRGQATTSFSTRTRRAENNFRNKTQHKLTRFPGAIFTLIAQTLVFLSRRVGS